MPAYYTNHEIQAIANAVIHTYPAIHLQNLYQLFVWKNSRNPHAWIYRASMSENLISALITGNVDLVVKEVNAIQRWGFGRKVAAQLLADPTFKNDLLYVLTVFRNNDDAAVAAREGALSKLLSHKGVNIASASKWICFLDQKRYAIFDSRVSIAFRDITLLNGKRVFPIVPRRATGSNVAWQSDTQIFSNPVRMARAYLDYLRVINLVSAHVGVLTPSQLEMALFMSGDVWRSGRPPLPQLPPGMWT